jgi:hypothetical protein
MHYEVISADCHVDLRWLPPDLFVNQSSSALRDRMPYVTDGPNGRTWMTKRGANLDLMNGMGSAGRKYVPGRIHRADRMASTGLYEDGKLGIRRLTEPELRVKDQDRGRRAGGGSLWRPGRYGKAERSGGRDRSDTHLQ